MRTQLRTLLVALLASVSMQAQYVVSDKYDLWFEDSGYEVTTRKSVPCTLFLRKSVYLPQRLLADQARSILVRV